MEGKKGKPVGVMDSGMGGLTVVKELERLLPKEDIIYFGDNANVPYGNRPEKEILELSCAMLDFLRKQDVKVVAIACNTISALAGQLRKRYEFPIVSIIEAACDYVAGKGLSQVGVIATEFTIQQGMYKTLLQRIRPEIQVHGIASRTLAALVDQGQLSGPAIKEEISSLVKAMQKSHPEVKDVVLGCTHYPIVQDLFEQAAPGLCFINPAEAQAKAVMAILSERGLLTDSSQPGLDIYTSGEKQLYDAMLKKLQIKRSYTITLKG